MLPKDTTLPLSAVDRFYSRIGVIDDDHSCWEWKDNDSGFDYGRIRIEGRRISAHRLSWRIHFGSIPDGMLVCHHCDNRKCARPDHLFLGTHQDNNKDMWRKGRGLQGDKNPSRLNPERLARGEKNGAYTHPEKRPKGEQNGFSKLDDKSVRDILYAHQTGAKSNRQMAREYGVTPSTIDHITNRRTWRHVEIPTE